MPRTKNKIAKLHIKKGDTVRVLSGKDRGQQGRVQLIVNSKNTRTGEVVRKAIIEGMNMVTKHKKPDQNNQQGGIVQTEAGIHVSKLMLVEPKTGKPTRVGRQKTEKGWVRVSKKTGEIIK